MRKPSQFSQANILKMKTMYDKLVKTERSKGLDQEETKEGRDVFNFADLNRDGKV